MQIVVLNSTYPDVMLTRMEEEDKSHNEAHFQYFLVTGFDLFFLIG